MGKAVVFLNGELDIDADACRAMVSEGDAVFCADGGANHAMAAGIVPDLVMGDMDSLCGGTRTWLESNGVEMKFFPAEKDCSDAELLLDHVCSEGFREIGVIAAAGGRLDHQLANLLLLDRYAAQGVHVKFLYRSGFIECVIGKAEVSVKNRKGWLFSFFPLSDTAVVSLEGFKYGLDSYTAVRGATIGLSNIAESDDALIAVHSGTIITMFQKDEEK